jgi:hypothetical protein
VTDSREAEATRSLCRVLIHAIMFLAASVGKLGMSFKNTRAGTDIERLI